MARLTINIPDDDAIIFSNIANSCGMYLREYVQFILKMELKKDELNVNPVDALTKALLNIESKLDELKAKKTYKRKENSELEYPSDIDMDIWYEWLKHCRLLGANKNSYAQQLELNELQKLSDLGYDINTLMLMAIEKGWRHVNVPREAKLEVEHKYG